MWDLVSSVFVSDCNSLAWLIDFMFALTAENDLLESLSRFFLFHELMNLHSAVRIGARFYWGELHWGLRDWNVIFFLSDKKTIYHEHTIYWPNVAF